MKYPKKKKAGYQEREALVDGVWPGERMRLWDSVRGEAARDDFNDAFAALWTARRIKNGTAVELASPEHDAEGLPMRIVS
jgi:predicted RNase H-like nuclease